MAQDKTIFLIRHGESTYNEWVFQSYRQQTWEGYRDPMLIDARLSQRGRQQVQALNQNVLHHRVHESIQVVITSPLARAIETALGGFEGTGIPIQVNSLCREMLDASCDVGRQPAELAREFSHRGIDVSKLSEYWWLNHPVSLTTIIPQSQEQLATLKETMPEFHDRVRRFLEHVASMRETSIAVVCHGNFISYLTQSQHHPANCEVRQMSLSRLWATVQSS
ncbi:unnamed protein product [Aphanomyces euteiches]|uniref:Histidine phosphatase family protein n=1 Tax=Aphanomyces euteiches TaxID=100861 RepID=A0A6G0XVL1_9STRA|nr:hypothetical protein Ae201684_001147 [Aphanomyces euteiches]KAH9099721.1 hypothetical protein Ae201684P_018732 [Aphanomyces euteiches]KAH9152260.1 hypothetical protein AeRB84_005271 [Aphanomyces euteiches]